MRVLLWPQRAVVGLIWLYQRTVSPDHSAIGRALFPYGYCKFTPSCSAYCAGAVSRFGVIRGLLLGVSRILRCAPWNPGGVDPVPPTGAGRGGAGRA